MLEVLVVAIGVVVGDVFSGLCGGGVRPAARACRGHSLLKRTKYSAYVFRFGLLGGSRMGVTPQQMTEAQKGGGVQRVAIHEEAALARGVQNHGHMYHWPVSGS